MTRDAYFEQFQRALACCVVELGPIPGQTPVSTTPWQAMSLLQNAVADDKNDDDAD